MTLDELYEIARRDEGTIAWELRNAALQVLTERDRRSIEAFRAGKRPWKRLRNEIFPVLDLLSSLSLPDARVRFSLNDGTEDAWVSIGGDWIGVQVTASLGTEDVARAMDLNEFGIAAGFVGRQDGPLHEHRAQRRKPREMYSREHALREVNEGIRRCLERKNSEKFEGMVLIVTTDLGALEDVGQWHPILPALRDRAGETPFRGVYVVDKENGSRNPIVLKGMLTAADFGGRA